jgi:DNA-binding beta-propeller fold protein YncE
VQPEVTEDTLLRFPGKVLADPEGNRLFISDSNHNRIVVASLDTYEVLDVIGAGSEGQADGSFEDAQFYRPQGLALVDNKLYIADTENHLIRSANLDSRTVTTIAGTGEQSLERDQSGPGTDVGLNSPWDLVAYEGKLYIAMAGPHQIWVYDLESGEIQPYAGSGREGIDNGPLGEASMAQPSGIDTDGTVLYVADPEASAIRTVDLNPDGEVNTIVGTGLFDFGDQDGTGDEVLLQHPLGVTVADDGSLYVADTYNSKIKKIDPVSRESQTYLGTGDEGLADGAASEAQFYEPGGIDFANGKLYIADTNNNAIRVVDMATQTVSTVEFLNSDRLNATASAAPTEEPAQSPFGAQTFTLDPQTVAPGEGTIQINVVMPEGYEFNTLAPFTVVWPDNATVQIPADQREFRQVEPTMPLEFHATFNEGQTEFSVNLTVYWCEAINQTLCFVDRPQLVIPVSVSAASDIHMLTLDHTLVPPTLDGNTFQ